MVVMVIMRPFPDIRWRDHIYTKDGEHNISYRRVPQYSMVLIIVENDKYPGQHHCRKYACSDTKSDTTCLGDAKKFRRKRHGAVYAANK